jgi:protein-S-isoprenylcysteine O-methyltransferase Ste14
MFHTLGRNLTDTVVTRRDAHFVNHGPYRLVRNPMYTGVLLLGMSLGLGLGTWLLPVAASLMFTLLSLRTRREEQYLIERFGDQYRSYMKRVGRFFPKRPG